MVSGINTPTVEGVGVLAGEVKGGGDSLEKFRSQHVPRESKGAAKPDHSLKNRAKLCA